MTILWKYINKAKAYSAWSKLLLHFRGKSGPPKVTVNSLIETFNKIKQLTELAVANSSRIQEALCLLEELHSTHPEAAKNYVWVLSTGRCGTLALESFLANSQRVRALHRTHMNTISFDERNEWFHRMLHDEVTVEVVELVIWKYLGRHINDIQLAVSQDKLHATINHGHVAFAPILSTLFPNSRFLYLYGDPERVFMSYYTKLQYIGQLEPLRLVRYGAGQLGLLPARWPVYKSLAWYLYITDIFSEALGQFVGSDRYVKLNNSELFNASRRGYDVLMDYFQVTDMSFESYQDHFSSKVNEKRKSIELSDAEQARLLADFRRVFANIQMGHY